jgi:hypothetical protein
MSRSNVTTIIERIRRQLESSIRMETNALAVSLTVGAESITLKYPIEPSLRVGSIISLGTELVRVMAVNVASKEVTVLRGWQDTEPEAHLLNAEVLINPRFTRFDIFDAIIMEIESWSPDLFWIEFLLLETFDETGVIKLPVTSTQSIGVSRVRTDYSSNHQGSWPEVSFVLQRGPADWPEPGDSGLVVRITDFGGYTRAGNAQVEVARVFDTSSIVEDSDLATFEVTSGLLELIELGVKMRLMADAETGRSQREAQDEPRRAEETPPGAVLTASDMTARRYMKRRNQEIHRLRARYPMRHW